MMGPRSYAPELCAFLNLIPVKWLCSMWCLLGFIGCAGPPSPCAEVSSGPQTSRVSQALSAPGRYALGEAAPYPDEGSLSAYRDDLRASQQIRRELGWTLGQRAFEMVEARGALAQRPIPRFQTWYGVEDLRRVFQYLEQWPEDGISGDQFTEDALIEQAFARNTSAVLSQEAWPENRLEAFLADLETDAQVRGAGGISRVLYSPRAAMHLVKSADAISECRPAERVAVKESEFVEQVVHLASCGVEELGPFRVAADGRFVAEAEGEVRLQLFGGGDCTRNRCEATGPVDLELRAVPTADTGGAVRLHFDARPPPETSCLEGGFPVGSAVVKVDYRREGFGVEFPEYATDASALSDRSDPAEWQPLGTVEPDPESIYRLELPGGNRFRLAALHLMTKELDHWAWASFWWSASPDTDFGADRPPMLFDTPLRDYKMCVATDFTEADPDPRGGAVDDSLAAALEQVSRPHGASWCSNPYIEQGAGNAATNCVGCHQYAGTDRRSEEILELPGHGTRLSEIDFPLDYVFSAAQVAGLVD
ncbi:MAG: hypothetical protein AAF355_01440 [Myxococcota bacterium]